MFTYILIFLIFAFIGWIIDTTYCSIGSKKFVFSGYFKYVPLCPIYGFGGLLILSLFIQLESLPAWLVIIITTILVVILEYVGGWFCDKILKEKLWDYSRAKFNISGYVNLLNSAYWLVLITATYFIINPYLEAILKLIFRVQDIFQPYDVFLSVIFVVAAVSFTIRTKDKRLEAKRKRRLMKIKKSLKKFNSRLKKSSF